LYETENVDLYYVTSYIEGCTLEKYCNGNDISFPEALSLFVEMLKVISYCHDKDILHRDIKPENIMLKDKGEEK
jgi:serine/threonine protein kinase